MSTPTDAFFIKIKREGAKSVYIFDQKDNDIGGKSAKFAI